MVFNREELLNFLVELDLELEVPTDIYIIGGSAAAIAYSAKKATTDIDTWSYNKVLFKAYKKLIQKSEMKKIPLAPVYVQIKSEKMKERFFKFNELKLTNLRVFVPDPEDLFLLKAQRASEKDVDDLKNLNDIKTLNPELILERFKSELLPQNPGNDNLLIASYLYCINVVFGSKVEHEHSRILKFTY